LVERCTAAIDRELITAASGVMLVENASASDSLTGSSL